MLAEPDSDTGYYFYFYLHKNGAEIDRAPLSAISLIFITSQKKKGEKSWISRMLLSLSSYHRLDLN